ncbi:hypothetical protein FQN57_001079 [Myotisia sp. PD_48]|nr:hypothetical protein FQN57_001079 [Myotisia sp. PD_48]
MKLLAILAAALGVASAVTIPRLVFMILIKISLSMSNCSAMTASAGHNVPQGANSLEARGIEDRKTTDGSIAAASRSQLVTRKPSSYIQFLAGSHFCYEYDGLRLEPNAQRDLYLQMEMAHGGYHFTELVLKSIQSHEDVWRRVDCLELIQQLVTECVGWGKPVTPDLYDPVSLNKHTLKKLQDSFKKNPCTNLLLAMPAGYVSKLNTGLESKGLEIAKPPPPPDFRSRLRCDVQATFVFPFSDAATKLLLQFSDKDVSQVTEESVLMALNRLVCESPKLWELTGRGVVLKCSDEIAVKVVSKSSPDYIEYTTLQYLAEKLPDFPAPKPHGVIKLGHCSAIALLLLGSQIGGSWTEFGGHISLFNYHAWEQIKYIIIERKRVGFAFKLISLCYQPIQLGSADRKRELTACRFWAAPLVHEALGVKAGALSFIIFVVCVDNALMFECIEDFLDKTLTVPTHAVVLNWRILGNFFNLEDIRFRNIAHEDFLNQRSRLICALKSSLVEKETGAAVNVKDFFVLAIKEQTPISGR